MIDVDKAFEEVEVRARALSPAFREIRPRLMADQREHYRDEQGPDGKWAPRAAATEAKRRQVNRRKRASIKRRKALGLTSRRRTVPKHLLGRLPKALLTTTDDLSVKISSRVKGRAASANQYGGLVGRRHRAKLKARPFLWPSAKVLNEARAILAKHVVKNWHTRNL